MREMKKMRKMRKSVFVLAIITTVLCGCDNSPMAKLKSDNKHPELASLWNHECANKSELWQEAVTYCKSHDGKPNCADVNFTYMLDTSNKNVAGKLDAHPLDSKF